MIKAKPMQDSTSEIAYLTAGAAGMYCGSCMHDNTLAAALTRLGVDIQLIPTYTPIRTDESDVSVDRVFFGGLNVYLQQKFSLCRYIPAWIDRLLDQPWLLRWATSRGVEVDPAVLGALAVSMLKGTHGYQRKEVRRLCRWLATKVRPDLVVLTNMLIGGCIPEIKRTLNVPVLVALQGDDIFLEHLSDRYRSQALAEIHRLVSSVDGFITNSRYYRDFMERYFRVPAEKMHHVPLGIDTRDFQNCLRQEPVREVVDDQPSRPPTIGFLARLAPEKGLHVLVDAFIQLRRLPGTEDATLRIAGWLSDDHRDYAQSQWDRLEQEGLGPSVSYDGSVDREGKVEFLRRIDVLSVPTTYRDPKGLFVLEALAAGVPFVQPDHGAFPEILSATGGGVLTPPNDSGALARNLHQLLTDRDGRQQLALAGQQAVHQRLDAETMAKATLDVFRRYAPSVGRQAER